VGIVIEDELRSFISGDLLGGVGARIEDDEALIATGRIDSLGLIRLLGHIQERWQVDLMASAGPDDFQSIATLAAVLRRNGKA
jgi:hypothetical protein